jgi:hypothetical protein
MHDAARLSDHAAARIDQLRDEGIDLTPAEIVRINALGWNVETPDTRLALSHGVPVEVGGVVLWPMTMRAYDWHRRVGCHLPTVWLREVATAYAMAHAYSEGRELDRGGVAAAAAVTAWGLRLKCRMDTLIEAMAQIIQQDESEPVPPNPDGKPLGIGDISASISAQTGQTPAEVERGMAMSHALRILHYAMEAQERVEGGKSGRGAAYIRANVAMAVYLNEIRESRKAGNV